MGELHEVPLLSLPGVVLLPGTLMPLHAFEPVPCRVLSAAMCERRLVVVQAAVGDARARVALGRIVSDRRHPDGSIDAFVHGLERARVTRLVEAPLGGCARASVAVEPDASYRGDAGRRLRQLVAGLMRTLARAARHEEALAIGAVLGSTQDAGLLANRLGATFLTTPEERQALLEMTCPGARSAWLTTRLGEVYLDATPAAHGH